MHMRDEGVNSSRRDAHLVTIAVFSECFTLPFSLTGTLFRIADAVRSCRMGPIAANPPVLMLTRSVPFKPVNSSCSLHRRMSRRWNHCAPGNRKQQEQQVTEGLNNSLLLLQIRLRGVC